MSSNADEEEIRTIIERQFASLSWRPGEAPDLDAFADDFADGAPLYPAARPVRAQAVAGFSSRMRDLSQGQLRSLDEQLQGLQVLAFGNVAVALGVCALTENDTGQSRNVEALLLVRDDGRWRIAAQAWDTETSAQPIPDHLLTFKPT